MLYQLVVGLLMRNLFLLGLMFSALSAGAQFASFGMNKPVHYFILTNLTTTAIFSPDGFCQTDIVNYTWKGKPGYSIPTNKIKAFVCDTTSCANLAPNETYIFARSGDVTAGGATFTTDSFGVGPNDSANWSGPSYFNVVTSWWSGRQAGAATQFSTSPHTQTCGGWTSILSTGTSGSTNATNALRWSNANPSCGTSLPLICIVDL